MRWLLMAMLLTACAASRRDAFHAASTRAIVGPSLTFESLPSTPDASASFTLDLEPQRHIDRVEGYLRADQPVLADRVCSEARVHEPAMDVVCGVAALSLGERHRAEERWIRAARSGSSAALLRLAALRLENRDWSGALEASTRLVRLAPPTYQGLRVHAAALSGIADYDRAEASLLRAVELAPERADAYLDLGVLHALHRSGLSARTLGYFERFIARAAGRPEYERVMAELTRRCPRGTRRRTARAALRAHCVPGLLVLAEEARPVSMADIEEMQRMAAEMEAANARQAAALEAEAARAERARSRRSPAAGD